jgi:hypothetical protein
MNGKRFRSTNFERPAKSLGPTDRAETLYFALNTLNTEYCFFIEHTSITLIWNVPRQ